MKFHYFYIAIVFVLEINAILPSVGAPSNTQLQKKPTTVPKTTTTTTTTTTNTSQITSSKKAVSKAPTKNQAGSPGKTVVLQGQVKRHKHPLKSLLKEEFDSPIHPITTDNKDF